MTLREALLTVAICTAETDAGDSEGYLKQVVELARSNPLFSDGLDTVTLKINTLLKLIHNTDPKEAVGLASTSLTPELRETAFKWATKMASNNGFLSEEKKVFLTKLVKHLMIDIEVAVKIYIEVARKRYP